MSRDQKLITKYLFPTYDLDLEFETNLSHHIHELMKRVWGGNFSSPIEQGLNNKKGFKVLDVGCGDKCLWLLELSKKYPLAEFIGLDLLPSSSLPKDSSQNNLRYIQGDILKGLPFEDNSIDFVHLRCLIVAFTERQWEEIIVKELIRICKPGGWIEISDIDVDGKSLGPTTKRFITACKFFFLPFIFYFLKKFIFFFFHV
jgi:ubiquinone/menaquinone biosynthesis C-methylase UbiE